MITERRGAREAVIAGVFFAKLTASRVAVVAFVVRGGTDAFSQSSSPRLKVTQTVAPSSSTALLLVPWPPGNLAADENVSVQWHLQPIPAPAQRTLLHLGQRSACA